MEYASLQALVEDKSLGLGDVPPSVDAIKRAIDSRLKALQAETLDRTSDTYRRLIDARAAADRLIEKAERMSEKEGNELIPVSAAMIDKLLAAIERVPKPAEKEPADLRPSVTEEMQAKQSMEVARASETFNRQRALPLAGLGTLAGAIWATRQAFGANLSHVGTTIWSSCAGGIILLALGVYLLSSRIQKRDEATLRRLFDPDVQAETVKFILDRKLSGLTRRENEEDYKWASRRREVAVFTRTEFRGALALQAQHGSQRGIWRPISSLMSTVDLENALDEATGLALTRLIELKALSKENDRFGLESYKPPYAYY